MPAPFLIIDLEATCWQGPESEAHVNENEIIEIGLAIVSSTNVLVWRGGWFVRPVVNPILSEFCKQLTSISQTDVDSADPLKVVLSRLAAQVQESTGVPVHECVFVSWGNYDRNQFKRDCARLEVDCPFGPHVNLKQEFLKKHHLKRAGVPTALGVVDLSFEGTHHRGADDAVNIARIFIRDFGSDFPFNICENRA